MKATYPDRCLNFCCEMARQLVKNGAEMYRVEESAQRLLMAYGFSQPEVFAIPAFVMISIEANGRNYTKSVRIRSSDNDLDKLERLNSLCRQVCSEQTELETANVLLQDIIAQPNYGPLIRYCGGGMAACFFTLLMHGSALDAVTAFCCGILVKIATEYTTKLNANTFFVNVSASMILVAVTLFLQRISLPIEPDKVIIGAIMLLVPGVAVTNVMRNVIAGDFLTAISKLTEVLIVSLAIAVGITFPYVAIKMLLGGF